MSRTVLIAGALVALTLAAALPATASAPPVGPLPPGQARPYDLTVLRQVSEANVGQNVVVVFRTVGRGSTKVVYGLTRGETRKAYASATFVMRVRQR